MKKRSNTLVNIIILCIWPLIILFGLVNELLEIFFPTEYRVNTRRDR